LASAYAGWAGSLAPDVAARRLHQALALADGRPAAFVDALLPTMFSKPMPRETVGSFCVSLEAYHPRGFRAMAQASAEDVRDVLPHVDVPTLLVYGERDARAPLTVAEAAQPSPARSSSSCRTPVISNLEAPDEFNAAIRDFLHDNRN
jgi:pimeloyl-ACP methyl ester carboxylesterase